MKARIAFWQEHGKRVSTVTNNHSVTEELLESSVFCAVIAEAIYGVLMGVIVIVRSIRQGEARHRRV
jgi:uncharacterized protein (DUF2062 family)